MAESAAGGSINIFGEWPALDIDGNIVLCPSISAAKHLALIYNVKRWPWLTKTVNSTDKMCDKKTAEPSVWDKTEDGIDAINNAESHPERKVQTKR